MSIRSLIEINHDFSDRLDARALEYLDRYFRSGDRQTADELERFGIKVVSQRHHSERYWIDKDADGFPAKVKS